MMAPFQSRACKYNPGTQILNGKETRATSGNPFPAHPQFCPVQQNSGRGEGLIYNIPAVDFQIGGGKRQTATHPGRLYLFDRERIHSSQRFLSSGRIDSRFL
jgi:hypothetical protein